MPSLKVIISGGGTGGHVFPAIAIADAIKKAQPEAEIHFVGAKGRMEMERVPKAGYTIDGLWISGIQRKLTLQNLSFPFKVVSSLAKASRIVRRFKPHVVVGVGGYASGPLLRVASSRGIPTLIQEQNSYPGITNKLLGARARRVCVAYPNMERWFAKDKIVFTGNPVREAVIKVEGKRDEAAEFFGLNPNKPVILAVGGSLGAHTINESISKYLENISGQGYQLIWQTGKLYEERARERMKNFEGEGVVSLPFIDRMDLAYALADLIVSRAGAMSISEICLVKKPSILIPSPNVAEDHQTKNAKALVDAGAAVLVTDKDARRVLFDVIEDLMKSEEKRKNLAQNTAQLAVANSAEKIANEVIKLAGIS